MGVERVITFNQGVPSWDRVKEHLARLGTQPIIRMIDGLPAFPDEAPAESWRELRVSLTGGMITIRRGDQQVTCVTWGDQDEALQKSWRELCEAWAAVGNGEVQE